ncbi:class I SAM-dependent methyltransferase [Methylobacterium trifolii]|uniref:tRNA U34 carboxymethyltransferase n=1 Tax=Methylobacterium trifolii TaxID=1003092 RepID=A0ABQ4U326_9HYPH|nr:class I SAM-dependent methyltransferase [Methylobacterium trifolii]GJE61874.1 tRNA U34 carboxymethyltransferase [Methylobacterium trifolii]
MATTRKQFVTGVPSHRNAYDLFDGRWASDLGEVDPSFPRQGVPGFSTDPRPRQAAEHLGRDGRFEGYDILELGPLEAAHSYQLERLGARSVLGIESNTDAFVKSLIVKNMLGLNRSTFLLGDVAAHLAEPGPRYDLIFCCGILYHMLDPVELIRLAAGRSDRLFIWTHYVRDQPRLKHLKPRPYRGHGLDLTLYEFTYVGIGQGTFWGGNRPRTHWLDLPAILAILARFGLSRTTIIADWPDFPNGPAVTLAASRPGVA